MWRSSERRFLTIFLAGEFVVSTRDCVRDSQFQIGEIGDKRRKAMMLHTENSICAIQTRLACKKCAKECKCDNKRSKSARAPSTSNDRVARQIVTRLLIAATGDERRASRQRFCFGRRSPSPRNINNKRRIRAACPFARPPAPPRIGSHSRESATASATIIPAAIGSHALDDQRSKSARAQRVSPLKLWQRNKSANQVAETRVGR